MNVLTRVVLALFVVTAGAFALAVAAAAQRWIGVEMLAFTVMVIGVGLLNFLVPHFVDQIGRPAGRHAHTDTPTPTRPVLRLVVSR